MDMQILVVAPEVADHPHLAQLLLSDQVDSFTLRFVTTLAELGLAQPAAEADADATAKSASESESESESESGSGSGSGAGSAPRPDVILLVAPQPLAALENTLQLLRIALDGVPVILLASEAAMPAAQALAIDGAVCIVAQPAERALLLPIMRYLIAITQHQRTLVEHYALHHVILESIADAVLSTDEHGRVIYANPAACQLMHMSAAEMRGVPIMELMALHDATTLATIPHPVMQTLASGEVVRLAPGCVLVRCDGTEIMIEDASAPIPSSSGKPGGVVMVFHDITVAHGLQVQVEYLARHDFLTGLPNRYAALHHLDQILVEAQARALPLAVMYLDLDKFKAINDTMGHTAGDALLVSVAERLRGCFRPDDFISRQGGDEFLVLMAPGTDKVDAASAALRIKAAVTRPHLIDSEPVHIGCSIGIALFPENGRSGDALLRQADTALHSAKAGGRNGWRFFSNDLLNSAIQRRQLEDSMRDSLERQEFQLFFQPKVRLSDGALCGCEALLRWHHPIWGWVDPARFIPSAEESGMIVPLGRWVLDAAIGQLNNWEAAGRLPVAMAINVSALELRHAGFAEYVQQRVSSAGMVPSRLQLELTESSLMRDMPATVELLHQLKQSGLSLAIDDFGTGYSSLSYLAELPIDLLKIDRSFVHGIDHAAPRRQTLLRAILALATALGTPTVAEGIETEDEAEFLRNAGCAMGQGFLYGRALDPGTFARRYLPLM